MTDIIIDAVASRRMVLRSIVEPRVKALARARLKHELVSGDHYRVEDRFDFFATVGNWRSFDHKEKGYGVGTLIAQVRLGGMSTLVTLPPEIGGQEAPAIGPVGDEAPLSDDSDTTAAPHATRPANETETVDVTLEGGEEPDVTAAAHIECGSRALLPAVTP